MLILGAVLVSVLVWVHLAFALAVWQKNNTVADIFWGMGFMLVAWTVLLVSGNWQWRSIIVVSLVTIWGLRLVIHIFRRSQGKKEDYRYAQWRAKWGQRWLIYSYLQVFVSQALLMLVIVSSAAWTISFASNGFSLLDSLGVSVWLMGFLFELIGDQQLATFKQNPTHKGKVMRHGLWLYTRHPNYFGEATQWWGIYLLALSVSGGWLTVISPLTITFLLLKVSGVPLLEKKYLGNPEFELYKQQTSVFIPWFPKKGVFDHAKF